MTKNFFYCYYDDFIKHSFVSPIKPAEFETYDIRKEIFAKNIIVAQKSFSKYIKEKRDVN